MGKIKSTNTKPELLLRKFLFSKGLRYRINYKKLPGKPDIVFPKYKTVIFVNGCFWHGHENCKIAHLPKTNIEFWKDKINKNINRDNNNIQDNILLGWKVLIFWECEIIKNNMDDIYKKVLSTISNDLENKTFKITLYTNNNDKVSKVNEDFFEYIKKNRVDNNI